MGHHEAHQSEANQARHEAGLEHDHSHGHYITCPEDVESLATAKLVHHWERQEAAHSEHYEVHDGEKVDSTQWRANQAHLLLPIDQVVIMLLINAIVDCPALCKRRTDNFRGIAGFVGLTVLVEALVLLGHGKKGEHVDQWDARVAHETNEQGRTELEQAKASDLFKSHIEIKPLP